MTEPLATAVLLLVIGLLVAVSVLFGRAGGRTGVPLLLIFLVVGMLAGSDGLIGIHFDDYHLAYRLGTVALVLILFDGGLQTPLRSLRQALLPAGLLATVGVLMTALLVAVVGRFLGLDWGPALLIGAMVSSTDAAAVFSVLRGSGLQLRGRTGSTLEVESGVNDPMAVILTAVIASALVSGDAGWGMAWDMTWKTLVQLVVGAAGGVVIGWCGGWLLSRIRLGSSMSPVFSIALAAIAYGLPSLMWGSGFLAVYIAGVMLGNSRLPSRGGLLRVHESLAWLGQVVMFVMLGLLVFPNRLLEVLIPGVILALLLAFVVRPLTVAAILLPLGFKRNQVLYIGWVGLRGAVPIILATMPLMLGIPDGDLLFDMVFVMVVVSALLPGTTVQWVTQWFGMARQAPDPPQASIELNAAAPIQGSFTTWFIQELSPSANTKLKDIPFPESCAVIMVVRGEKVIPARGETMLLPGDHVTVLSESDESAFLHLVFGQEMDE